jgi:solute carrier family 14 (urea transporter)
VDEPAPLHELVARVVAPGAAPRDRLTLPLGTMQELNRRLANRPVLDFVNATLRGAGQVIFANNPLSGALLLAAMFLQAPWLGVMTLAGVTAATLAAKALRLSPPAVQNGIFGLNGVLIGAAIGFAGRAGNGPWNPVWIGAAVVLSALATLVMQTVGTWFATRLQAPPLGVAFNGLMLGFVLLVVFVPQTWFDVGPPPLAFPPGPVDGLHLARSLPAGLGQVFFCDGALPLLLILLAVGLCTPLGLGVALLGCAMWLLAGLLLGARPGELYLGLWGYNAALTATAIGGVFYAPNRRSITIGALCAFLASAASIAMARWLSPLHLPVLSIPFTIVTLGCFWVLRRTIPSLVPVALHAVASPEEHERRYVVARDILTGFRRGLAAAARGEPRMLLFARAPAAVTDELRRLFDAIDQDHDGALTTAEVMTHLAPAGVSAGEVAYLFERLDADGSGRISCEELGELVLRHRRLMARYDELFTYFLPIDVDRDDVLGPREMNTAMASVGEPPLTADELAVLARRTGGQPLTWNRFVELVLLI